MKKNLLRITLLAAACLLLIGTSCGWILSASAHRVRTVQVDYRRREGRNLSIVDADSVRMEVLYEKETGVFVPCEAPLSFEGLVPGDTVDFRIRLSNRSGASQSARLLLAGIEPLPARDMSGMEAGERERLFAASLAPMLYVSLVPGAGYADSEDPETEIPEPVFLCLGEAAWSEGQGYSLCLTEDLIIPDTGEGFVELQGYFWFDRSADSAYEDAGCRISLFRLLL